MNTDKSAATDKKMVREEDMQFGDEEAPIVNKIDAGLSSKLIKSAPGTS